MLVAVIASLIAMPALASAKMKFQPVVLKQQIKEPSGSNSWLVLQPKVAMSRLYQNKIIALGNHYGTATLELCANNLFIDTEFYGDSSGIYHEITLPEGYTGYTRIVITMGNTTVVGMPIQIQ